MTEENLKKNITNDIIAMTSTKEEFLKNVSYILLPISGKENCVHKTFLDLGLFLVIQSEQGNSVGNAYIPVEAYEGLKNRLELSDEEIESAANRNAAQKNQPVIGDMFGYMITGKITDKEPSDYPHSDMLIMTCESMLNGATVLPFAKEKLDRVCEECFTNELIILPSSKHEWIIPNPILCNQSLDKLSEMVRAVNETEVAPYDFLSNSVYRYIRSSQRFEIAA